MALTIWPEDHNAIFVSMCNMYANEVLSVQQSVAGDVLQQPSVRSFFNACLADTIIFKKRCKNCAQGSVLQL